MDHRDSRDLSRKRKSISPTRERDAGRDREYRDRDREYRDRDHYNSSYRPPRDGPSQRPVHRDSYQGAGDGPSRGPPAPREPHQGAGDGSSRSLSAHRDSHPPSNHHAHAHHNGGTGAPPPGSASQPLPQRAPSAPLPAAVMPANSTQPPPPQTVATTTAPAVAANGPTNYDKYKSLSDIKYPYMTDFGEYERQTKIGQGTFGEVFKAKCRRTGRTVALKKILMENEKEGFPITALREIKILKEFKDANVVELLDICSSKASDFNRYRSTFYLVFEFCEHDLAGLLSNAKVQFKEGETKTIMKQLLSGLFFIHAGKVLHRDMKTSNILINKEGVLKIADFGLARAFSQLGTKEKPNRFTNRVVTLWYRPPELLLGDRNYTPAIDVWGAACIMCELWTRSPILQGTNEQHQLQLITQFCGSITPEVYPDVANLELYKTLDLPKDVRRSLKERLKDRIKDPCALDLIDKLFTVNPVTRPDCDEALNHDYFWSDPMPANLSVKMKTLNSSNFEFTANSTRQQQQQVGNRAPSQAVGGHGPPGAGGFFRDRVF